MVPQRLIQRGSLFLGRFLQKRHAPLSQIPFGHIGNPPKGQIVLIGDHAQVGQGILDLHPVKKLDTAVYRVGDLLLKQPLLHRPGDVVGTIKYCDLPVRRPRFMERLNLPGNPGGLFLLGLGKVAYHRHSGRQGGL